jgi:hypothetical protein
MSEQGDLLFGLFIAYRQVPALIFAVTCADEKLQAHRRGGLEVE